MSLPSFSTQSGFLHGGAVRQPLCPKRPLPALRPIGLPALGGARPTLEKCYCPENGRTAIEPVVMLGVSLLQDIDGVPDRQAVEMLRYHAGWNFALNRQLGDEVFHPTSLVNFRHRLEEHQQSALGFTTILTALEEAGLVSRQSRQRLDSTQMFGRVARMSRLDCVREACGWRSKNWKGPLRRRRARSSGSGCGNVMSKAKPTTASAPRRWDASWWRRAPMPGNCWSGCAARGNRNGRWGHKRSYWRGCLASSSKSWPASRPSCPRRKRRWWRAARARPPRPTRRWPTPSSQIQPTAVRSGGGHGAVPVSPPELGAPKIQPKDKGQLSSDRVQNPHDPEATYSVKGQGQQKKEHVGYKVQWPRR